MSKSTGLRVQDVRAIHDLAHECRDLGDDPVGWRRHWSARIAVLVGADLAIGGELRGLRTGAPQDLGSVGWGWENGFNLQGWRNALDLLEENPNYSVSLDGYTRKLRAKDGIAVCRSEIVDLDEWSHCLEHEAVFEPMGADYAMWCFRFIPGQADEVNGGVLCRAIGRRDFNAREKAVVTEAYRVLAPFVGTSLARFREPCPSQLPPRVRQVLRCMLEGDSDKQIAARLGISKHTVNQYGKVIFRHFGVQSRPELLARWIRRGWGAAFAWAEE